MLDQDTLGEREAEAPVERVAVGEVDTVEVTESVVLGVGQAEPVAVDAEVCMGGELRVGEGVLLLDSELLPLLEGVVPLVSEPVGDADSVELVDVVVEGVVGGVAVLEEEVLAVLLAEAPADREAVDEEDTVELLERVGEGVNDPVLEPLPVGEPVGEELGGGGGVPLLKSELLPLLLALAPLVSEAVGEADSVELAEVVGDGVSELAPVPVPVGVGVGVCVGHTEAGTPEDADEVGVVVVVVVGGVEFVLVPVGV